MATMAGVLFFIVFLFAPERGMVAKAARQRRQKWEFAQTALAIHLLHHENTADMATECRVDHLHYHMHWEPNFSVDVVRKARHRGLIERQEGDLFLTEKGRLRARSAMVQV
jgi:manganese/zinc/iron transport system permease protein